MVRIGARLLGRHREREQLDGVIEAVRDGESRAVVVRGEAGVGKTALLEYLLQRAGGCRVLQAAGVEAEMELAFAGLHQLCAPILERVGRLPSPQSEALRVAFGLGHGDTPDRFFVALAALSLLSDESRARPLVCVVDDAHWLDRASAEALGFVARRLGAEPVALVLAVREPTQEFACLPEIVVEGLPDLEARELLESAVTGPLDERVRERIVVETRGNPLALLELARRSQPAELAGGFGPPAALPLSDWIESGFSQRIEALPDDCRELLVVVAAEPAGDPALVWRAAARLGIELDAAAPAVAAGLLEPGVRACFRHPLVRSAAYRTASPEARRAVHAALAESTDPDVDPDRRAWHRGQATLGPDEKTAAELEQAAARAHARGGFASAAAFLERATALTPEPDRRAWRSLAAARAKHQAGAPDRALELLAVADAAPLDQHRQAKMELLHAQVVFGSGRGCDAPRLLVEAARRLETLDIELARDTYLDALCALAYVGPSASGVAPVEVAQAALAVPRPTSPRASDLLLDGVAILITEGYGAAAPALRRALSAYVSHDDGQGQSAGWGWLACHIASTLWEHETQYDLAARYVRNARDGGALAALPHTLSQLAGIHLRTGELKTAAAMSEEVDAAVEATGSDRAPYLALSLAAFRGREQETTALIEEAMTHPLCRGGGIGLFVVEWARALLYNGLGRYEDALGDGRHPAEHTGLLATTPWILPETVEAAVRVGRRAEAADALQRLSEMAHVSGTDWALGLEARSRALVCDSAQAESLYREAIERLGRAGQRMELARSRLVYGEWLRRESRRVDAREQLRPAHDALNEMGAEAFAERTRRELLATGERVRKRSVEARDELTVQEGQIARLAATGLTNPQIASQLFISPRTVEWHLKKVFKKLGVGSRRQLRGALRGETERPGHRQGAVRGASR